MTLPGSIPGLLRRGSPVVSADDDYEGAGVVQGSGEKLGTLCVCWGPDLTQDRTHESLALDLTDATGRAHAAWHFLPLLQADARRRLGSSFNLGAKTFRDHAVLLDAAMGHDADPAEVHRICMALVATT